MPLPSCLGQLLLLSKVRFLLSSAVSLQEAEVLRLVFAAGPSGYNAAKDTQDSYQFIYPFGWQEVSVQGTDVVYKDIIEPLESASVTISKTDKQSVDEFGSPLEVMRSAITSLWQPATGNACLSTGKDCSVCTSPDH